MKGGLFNPFFTGDYSQLGGEALPATLGANFWLNGTAKNKLTPISGALDQYISSFASSDENAYSLVPEAGVLTPYASVPEFIGEGIYTNSSSTSLSSANISKKCLKINSNKTVFKYLHDGSAFTIYFSFKVLGSNPLGNPNCFGTILTTNQALNTNVGVTLFYDDRASVSRSNRIVFNLTNGTSFILLLQSTDNKWPINQYNWGKITHDGTTYTLTINGEQVGTATRTGSVSSANQTQDARFFNDSTRSFGLPAINKHIAIWDRVLTAAEQTQMDAWIAAAPQVTTLYSKYNQHTWQIVADWTSARTIYTDRESPLMISPAPLSTDWDYYINEIGNHLYFPNEVTRKNVFAFTGTKPSAGLNPANILSQIGLAYSTDGITWTKYASNPIISDSPEFLQDPYILQDGSTFYLLCERSNEEIIGFSASDLFGVWTSLGVILPGASTWETQVASPIFYKEGDTYYIFYEAASSTSYTDGVIGIAECDTPTGTYINRRQVTLTSSWADVFVPDDLVKIDGTYYLLWHGESKSDDQYRCGIATASAIDGPYTDIGSVPINSLPNGVYTDITRNMMYLFTNGQAIPDMMYFSNDFDGVRFSDKFLSDLL